MYDGAMETVEYMWVNIWCILDLLWDLLTNTKLQKFTSLAYSYQLVTNAQNEMLLWLAGMDFVKI